MERLTWVDEDGTILFQKPNQLLGDLAFTITELAKKEEYDFLEVIAERLANREQSAELYKRKYKEAWDELSVERERHKWIPTKERLPEDRTAVIATVLHRKWICDHDLDESEQTIYPERYEVCTVYRDGDKYIKLDEGYTETIVVPVGKQDDDIGQHLNGIQRIYAETACLFAAHQQDDGDHGQHDERDGGEKRNRKRRPDGGQRKGKA